MQTKFQNQARILIVSLFGLASPSWGADLVPLTTDRVFSPEGFDDNDNVQVVLDGWMSSSCNVVKDPEVIIHSEYQTIEVTAQAEHGGHYCLPVMTRFTSVANLGVLPWGKWEIVTNNGWLTDTLMIAEASNSGPDDGHYAQVDNVYVDYAPELKDADSRWSVVLEGTLQSSCQSIEEIKVTNSGDTFEVLPILRDDDHALQCLPVIEPYVVRAFLPEFDQDGRYLVHVRSRDGQALNKVFSAIGN